MVESISSKHQKVCPGIRNFTTELHGGRKPLKNLPVVKYSFRTASLKAPFILMFILVLSITSCIGVETEISINPDSSGQILMEYRIRGELESLGTLDGNQRWLTIPVGRADFERSLSRLPGIKLVSFTSKSEGSDQLHRVKLDFTDLDALMSFLNDAGRHADIRRNGSSRLTLTLSDGAPLDENLRVMVKSVMENYRFKLTVKSFLSSKAGKTTEYSSSMGEILVSETPVIVEIDL